MRDKEKMAIAASLSSFYDFTPRKSDVAIYYNGNCVKTNL